MATDPKTRSPKHYKTEKKETLSRYTFALCIPLELDDDGLVSFKLEHLSWSCLLGEVLQIAPP
jgi:hypothetical protein